MLLAGIANLPIERTENEMEGSCTFLRSYLPGQKKSCINFVYNISAKKKHLLSLFFPNKLLPGVKMLEKSKLQKLRHCLSGIKSDQYQRFFSVFKKAIENFAGDGEEEGLLNYSRTAFAGGRGCNFQRVQYPSSDELRQLVGCQMYEIRWHVIASCVN